MADTVTGTVDSREMLTRMRALMKTFPAEVGAGQMRYTERLALKCQQITPFKTGVLRSTVHAEGPFTLPDGTIETRIVGGGPRAPYGAIVHENRFAFHAPPTQWKYIEDPLKAAQPTAAREIAAEINLDRL